MRDPIRPVYLTPDERRAAILSGELRISGGADDDTEPELPVVPDDLSTLSEEDLAGLHGELQAAYEGLRAGAPTPELRDKLKGIREQQTRIAAEATQRIELAEELEGLDAPVALPTRAETPPETPAETPATPAETPAAPAVADDDPNKPKPLATDPTPAPVQGEPVAATAGQEPIRVAAEDVIGGRETQGAPPVPSNRPAVAMTAAPGTDLQGQVIDFAELGALVQERRTGPYARDRIAHVAGFEATPNLGVELLSRNNTTEVNDRLIREAVDAHMRRQWPDQWPALQGMVAAICDPLDIIREIPDCVEAAEPFSDSLPQRPAGRLGYQFTPSMSISDFDNAVSEWGEADQAAVDPDDPDTWKPCIFVDCPTPSEVRAEAVTACFYFDNTTDMSNPERIQDAMKKIAARKARLKTARLLQIADTFSHHFEAIGPYGALPGFVEMLLTVLPQGEYPERLEDGTPYNVYTPPGLLEALVIDRDNKAFLTDAERGDVAAYVQDEARSAGWNVRLIDLEDVSLSESAPFAALPAVNQAAVGLPGLGGAAHPFTVRVLAPQAALYFSTGEINVGIERSPELLRRNQAQWFMEEYLGLTKHGCHPWFTLNLTLCPNGSRAAAVTPYTCHEVLT